MKSHARVVVIGGGIFGCSLLYHLTKLGWSDVVLVEKGELTSGSTWHAAGNTPHFEASLNMTQVQMYSTDLYQRLEAETGQATGFHKSGSIRLATTRDRMDQFKQVRAQARYLDLPFEIIGPNEIKSLHPFLSLDDVVGGAYTPADGFVDPASVTQAMAKGARMGGAEIYRHTRVTGLAQKPNGEWEVTTDKGTITAEIVVNAAGAFAVEIGAMVGLSLPIIMVEHQYLVTESIPEIEAFGSLLPVIRDPDASFYLRQEQNGLDFGPYETTGAKTWGVDGIPSDFDQELLAPDLDRIQPFIEMGMERVPILKTVGIKEVINGPISHTPDGGVLLGPAFGLDNFWLACGASVGISQGGGCGKYLAQWMVEGEAEIDMLELDSRRFGPYATKDYSVAKALQTYHCMYFISYPNEERPAGRPARTDPLYERHKAEGAVLGERFGWERPTWFAPKGVEPVDQLSFRRTNWFPHVGAECRAVRERVGVLDLTSFAKYEVSGPGAEAFLDRLCANRLPRKIGGIVLTHMLTERGGIECEMTITRVAPDRFYILSGAVAELHDLDWMRRHMPEDGGVVIDNVTMDYGTLVVAGPRAREVLAKLTEADLSNAAFPWLSAQEITVGNVRAWALRINYVGELGWELHHPIAHQLALYEALMAAGEASGIANFGTRAMDSLRLEKGYRAWGTELTTEVTPLEAGLDRFIRLDKGDFIGREALVEAKRKGFKWKCVCLTVEADDTDAYPNQPVLVDGKVEGIVTSGGYGHVVEQSIALAYVNLPYTAPGTALAIDILGQLRPAKVVEAPLYDPENLRLRS